jgi:hypothetical protein
MRHQGDKFWSYKKEIKVTNATVCGEGVITLGRPMVESSKGRQTTPHVLAVPPELAHDIRTAGGPVLALGAFPSEVVLGARPQELALGACPLHAGGPLGVRPLACQPEFPRLTGM